MLCFLVSKCVYTAQYFVELWQPSVMYVYVHSLGFSSFSLSCLYLRILTVNENAYHKLY